MHTFRTATTDDLSAIEAIICAAEPVDHNGRVNRDGTVRFHAPADLNDLVVATADATPIGFGCILQPLQDGAYDSVVMVHPAWRRRGVGSTLVQQLAELLRTRRATLMSSYRNTPATAAFVATFHGTHVGTWLHMVADPLPTAALHLADGYTIRTAVPGQDEATFANLFRDTFSQHRFLLPPSADDVRRFWEVPSFDPRRVAFAEYNGKPVGVSAVREVVVYRGDEMITSGHIGPVGVQQAHRQRGLARALMLHNRDYAAQRGWQTLDLNVDAVNVGAIALYRSLGFEVADEIHWWRSNKGG